MATINKNQGESITIDIILGESIELTNVNEIVVSLGDNLLAKYSSEELIQNNNTFTWRIKSDDTRLLLGIKDVIVSIDLDGYGNRKTAQSTSPKINFLRSDNPYNNTSESTIFTDVAINIEVVQDNLVANEVIMNVYQGLSNYQLAIQNGVFEGTEEEYVNWVNAKEISASTSATNAENSATDAYNAKVDAESARDTAITNASQSSTNANNAATANTNAQNAKTSAETAAATATTKAGEASTSATNAANAKTAAESARDTAITKASEASTSATNAATSATNAATANTNAQTAATTATTKASEAAASAANAATSETNAAASAALASNTRIASWVAQSYASSSQVNYQGKDYVANAACISTDIPGISSKWDVRLTQYEPTYLIGKNKYNKNTNVVGFISTTNGTLTTTGAQALASLTSDYIPITPSTVIYVSGRANSTGVKNIAFYDASKTLINTPPTGSDWGGGTGNQAYTTTSNTYFIRITVKYNGGTDYSTTTQVEYGSSATAYEAYTRLVTQIGSNDIYSAKVFYNSTYYTLAEIIALLSLKGITLETTSATRNLYNKAANIVGFISGSTGLIVNTGTAGLASLTSDYIPIAPSSVIYVSGRANATGVRNIAFYDANKTLINTPPTGSDWNGGVGNQSYTTTSNTYYIRITLKYNGGTDYSDTAQVEYGNAATSYIAYSSAVRISKIDNQTYFDIARQKVEALASNVSTNTSSISSIQQTINYTQDNPNYDLASTESFYKAESSQLLVTESTAYLTNLGIKRSVSFSSGQYISGTTRRDLYYYYDYAKVIDSKYIQVAFFIKTDDPNKFYLDNCFVAKSTTSFQSITMISKTVTLVDTNLYKVVKTFQVPSSGSWTGVFIGSGFSSGGTAPTDALTISGFFCYLSDTDISSTEVVNLNIPNDFKRIRAVELSIPSSSTFITNKLYGKKISVLGDSITAGAVVGATNTYHYVVSQRNGAIDYNYGISGTCLALDSNESGLSMCNPTRYNAIEDTSDYIIVYGGTNDPANSVPIGTDSDATSATFKGALNILITGLINKFPSKKIGFIAPMNCRAANATLPYVDAIIARCGAYGIPVLDLYRTGGINPYNDAQRAALMADFLHPNIAGHLSVADKYEAFLRNM